MGDTFMMSVRALVLRALVMAVPGGVARAVQAGTVGVGTVGVVVGVVDVDNDNSLITRTCYTFANHCFLLFIVRFSRTISSLAKFMCQ